MWNSANDRYSAKKAVRASSHLKELEVVLPLKHENMADEPIDSIL